MLIVTSDKTSNISIKVKASPTLEGLEAVDPTCAMEMA